MAQMEQNKTLYVGNLDPSVNEDLIMMLFGQLGEVKTCKMFRERPSDPYCFVEFNEHLTALNAITMMNDKMLQNRKMRVNWVTFQRNKNEQYTKVDTSQHHHVYVGDLSPEIDEQTLREAFQVFGEISDVKVVKDQQTLQPRGYGFVVFVKKMDAEAALASMNGQWLGGKMIKTRWAFRKPANTPNTNRPEQKKLDYREVFNQTTPTNTTVFCGGLNQEVTEEMIQEHFQSHGTIEKIKIFKEKGYAFIKYTDKESACQAIVDLHNSTLNGNVIGCSWGKDSGPTGPPGAYGGAQQQMPTGGYNNGHQAAQYNQMGQQMGQQMGYWQHYPQQMQYNQMYNQYPQHYGYQQPNPGQYMQQMGWGQQQQQGWGAPQQPDASQQQQPQQ